jgi:hypothetical protein
MTRTSLDSARPETTPAATPASVTSSSSLLVTDADREAAAAIVRRALAEGSLTVEEAEGRLTASYAARRQADLDEVLVDLPQKPASPNPLSRSSGFARAPGRLAAVALLGVLAVAVAAASVRGHAAWPLIPLGFLAIRALWWRGRWHGRWARHARQGGSPGISLDTRASAWS